MMGQKNPKKRTEIDRKYQWDLEAMFPNRAAWQEELEDTLKKAEEFASLSDRISQSSAALLQALDCYQALSLAAEKVYAYAKMRMDEDTAQSSGQEDFGRANSMIAKVSGASSFFIPEILTLSREDLDSFLQEEPKLKKYALMLKRLFRKKAHTLSAPEEKLLSSFYESLDAPSHIYEMLKYADMKYGLVQDDEGQTKELTDGNYIRFMESRDRKTRKAAYEAMYRGQRDHINAIAAAYNANVKTACLSAEIRKYPGAQAAALFDDHIPSSVYSGLIQAVHSRLPSMYRYINLRSKLMGLDQLTMYDMYAPLLPQKDKKISFEEACELMMKALAPLGEDYLDVCRRALKERWIDVYPSRNKYSGAYSYGVYGSHPYILMNYENSLQDVLTLVHEMGHSLHSYYTNLHQDPAYRGYSIFVAEVASTVNENLLISYLLDQEKEEETKKVILNKFLDECKATIFRQTMFAEFELICHEYVEAGGTLTPAYLCSEYGKLNRLYHGDQVKTDEDISFEWARIPHFYSNFYVYQYATGFSAAIALAGRILQDGESAVKDYKKFLTLGSCMDPLDELLVAGVDMRSCQAVEKALDRFDEALSLFETLTEKKTSEGERKEKDEK